MRRYACALQSPPGKRPGDVQHATCSIGRYVSQVCPDAFVRPRQVRDSRDGTQHSLVCLLRLLRTCDHLDKGASLMGTTLEKYTDIATETTHDRTTGSCAPLWLQSTTSTSDTFEQPIQCRWAYTPSTEALLIVQPTSAFGL